MATPFFNKKEDPFTQRPVNPNAAALGAMQASAAAPVAAAAAASQSAAAAKEGESKLTVGPNI